MSPVIETISVIAPLDNPIAATGEANGAATSPATTKTANR